MAIERVVEAIHGAIGALETITGIALAGWQGGTACHKPGQCETQENRFHSHGTMISVRRSRARRTIATLFAKEVADLVAAGGETLALDLGDAR